MGILGQHLGKQVVLALGLPKYTVGFTLHARVGELVRIECEYVPEDGAAGGDFATALAQYQLIPANQQAREVFCRAEVIGYDAWRTEQIEEAHRKYMARTSRHLPCDRSTESIARYMGAPV